METFNLIGINNLKCNSPLCQSTNIQYVIVKKSQFIGCYCSSCGPGVHQKLEDRNDFIEENTNWRKENEPSIQNQMSSLQKIIHSKKIRQKVLQYPMQVQTLERKKPEGKLVCPGCNRKFNLLKFGLFCNKNCLNNLFNRIKYYGT